MKKAFLLLITVFALSAAPASAQLGIGFGFGYGSAAEALGFDSRLTYTFSDVFAIATSADIFFSTNPGVVTWDFNGHYTFHNTESMGIYGLAGLDVAFSTFDVADDLNDALDGIDDPFGILDGVAEVADDDLTEIGLNVGAGINFFLTDAKGVVFFVETKYVLSEIDQFVGTGGFRFNF